MAELTTRPTPLRDTARIWSLVAGGVGTLATFLVTNQVLNAGQAETLTNTSASVNLLISAITAVITAVSSVAAAFGTAKQAESKVTPMEDPRVTDAEGRLLKLMPTAPVGPDTTLGGGL
jgi:hypothetical protein